MDEGRERGGFEAVERWATKDFGARLRRRFRSSRNMQARENMSDFWGSMV